MAWDARPAHEDQEMEQDSLAVAWDARPVHKTRGLTRGLVESRGAAWRAFVRHYLMYFITCFGTFVLVVLEHVLQHGSLSFRFPSFQVFRCKFSRAPLGFRALPYGHQQRGWEGGRWGILRMPLVTIWVFRRTGA